MTSRQKSLIRFTRGFEVRRLLAGLCECFHTLLGGQLYLDELLKRAVRTGDAITAAQVLSPEEDEDTAFMEKALPLPESPSSDSPTPNVRVKYPEAIGALGKYIEVRPGMRVDPDMGVGGVSVLHRLVYGGRWDLTRLPLKACADPNARDVKGGHPSTGQAVYQERSSNYLNQLSGADADPNARDHTGGATRHHPSTGQSTMDSHWTLLAGY